MRWHSRVTGSMSGAPLPSSSVRRLPPKETIVALKNPALSLVLLLSLLIAPAAAQSVAIGPADGPADGEREEAARKVLQTKASALLDQVIATAPSLNLPANRMRIRTTAAQLLWPRDQTRARSLIREALADLNDMAADLDPDNQQDQQIAGEFVQLRAELLQTTASLDPALARDILRSTRLPAIALAAGYANNDSEVEMNLATQIAARDPKQALQMAEESLEKGLSPYLISVLSNLHVTDKAAAAKLAGEIVARLRSENLATNAEAVNVAVSLVRIGLSQSAQRISDGAPAAGESVIGSEASLLSENTLREVLGMVVTAALKASPQGAADGAADQVNAMNLLMSLQSMSSEIEQFSPSYLPELRKKLAEFEQTPNGARVRTWSDYNKLAESGSVEVLLEAAADASPEMQPNFYQLAAQKAFGEGDVDRARRIVSEYVTEPNTRNQILAGFDNQLIMNATQANKIQQARGLIARLRSREERATMLAQLAASAAAAGDKKTALELLDEARDQIGTGVENLQLQIAQYCAQIDPSRSFGMLEPMVGRINELVAAAAVLDGFDGSQNFRDGEMQMHNGGTFASMVQQWGGALGALAIADFERARIATDGLQRNEARLMARFLIAQSVLSSLPTADAPSEDAETDARVQAPDSPSSR
jgi:hypothetical protein